MKRTAVNLIVDIVAFIGFVVLTTTGILMRYILPPGSGGYLTLWGFDRHEWGDIHFWVSIVFFSILAFHLFLHWRWVLNVVAGRPHQYSGIRLGLGVVGFLAVIALAISPLLAPVERNLNNSSKSIYSSHKYNDVLIRGSMTLLLIEDSTGVPANYIIESLKLPQTIPIDKSIGSLKKQYGFEINDVRAIVKEYQNKKISSNNK